MCNHKVPALLPFKTVKGLNDYVGFKEDGTMEVGGGLEVDGYLKTNEMLVMELFDYQFDHNLDFPTSPFGIYHFTDADSINDYTLIGMASMDLTEGDGKIYLNGFINVSHGSWLYAKERQAFVTQDRSTVDYSKANYVDFDKKFRHTVVIKMYGGISKPIGAVSFTDISESNTKIDSYQDLHSLFGGKILSVSGNISTFANSTYTITYPITIDLTGGTMAKDYINVLYASTNVPIPVYLSDLGASSFVIEDSVTTI